MNTIKELFKFCADFSKGISFDLKYVKNIVTFAINNIEDIKQQLSSLSVKELSELTYSYYTKKDDLIDKVASSIVDQLYFCISGESTISYIIDFKSGSIENQKRAKIEKALEELTEEKLNMLLEKRKEEFLFRQEQILNPKTIEDFEQAIISRKLSVEEKRIYEELLADRELKRNKEKESRTANKVSLNGKYSITKTKDTRDNKDLWVLKFDDKSDNFKELNRQMKALGGAGYSRFTRGFNFYFDPSDKLNEMYGQKDNCNNDKAECDSEELIKIKTLLKEEKIKYLYKVSDVSHVKLIKELLEDISDYENIDKAKYPLNTFSKADLTTLLCETKNVKNTMMVRKRLSKLLKSDEDNLDTRRFSEDIIELYDKAINASVSLSISNKKICQYKLLKTIGITSKVLLRACLREYYNNILEPINKPVLSLYKQLEKGKIDVLDILKEGVSLNKYAVEFNTLYHKKILEAANNKNKVLKEITLEYLENHKCNNLENITFHEVGKIINSTDFNRESKSVKEDIVSAFKNLVKEDLQCKNTIDGGNKVFRYYLTNRPPSIGTQPNGTIQIEAFNEKQFVSEINREAWGYISYNRELTLNEMYEYELVKLKGYDEKKADAKKEILLSGVAYNGIRTVKIVADFYKDNMFNVEVIEKGDRYTSNEAPLPYDESIEYALRELFYENNKDKNTDVLPNDNKEIKKDKNKKEIQTCKLSCEQLDLFSIV